MAIDLLYFTQGYIECALWSSLDDDGESMDSNDAPLSSEAQEEMRKDCEQFVFDFSELLEAAGARGVSDAQLGHDFWLTRNHHGAGYWDRKELDADDLGKKLTEAAHSMGEIGLYVGNNGEIYVDY